MNLTYKTFRYLTRGYTVMTLIAFACILACVAVTDLVFHLTDPYDGVISTPASTPLTVPTEVTAWLFALVAAIALFVTNFKVMLANGVSRPRITVERVALVCGTADCISRGVASNSTDLMLMFSKRGWLMES